MGRTVSTASNALTVTNVPLGGYASVFGSGDAYKAVGQSIQRSLYPEMAVAFPRKGAFSFSLAAQPLVGSSSQALCGTYGKGMFVIMMSSVYTNTSTDSLSSTDGITWSPATTSVSVNWTGICYGNNKFVAVGAGQGGIAGAVVNTNCSWSTDGVIWTTSTMPSRVYTSVIWSDQLGLFIAFTTTLFVSTSPDGITWTSRATPAGSGGTYMSAVASPTCVVAVATNGAVLRTVDGITFTLAATTSRAVSSVAYGNSLFALTVTSATAAGTGVLTSSDGITWTTRSTPANYYGGYIAFGDSVFTCVGSGANGALTSDDGIKWTQRPSGMVSPPVFGTYGSGAFLFCADRAGSGTTYHELVYTENTTTSDYLYISGTAGNFVRVR
jgi:hypothetical protein